MTYRALLRGALLLSVLPLLLLAVIACRATPGPAEAGGLTAHAPTLSVQSYVDPRRLARPTDITHAGDERLFVTERDGVIRVIEPGGQLRATPFLSITDRVRPDMGEFGLLGLAFHPNYQENGHFYVNYTALPDGDTRIARFEVSADDPNVADPSSELTILALDQPYPNHNGGDLAFGPDGYLYIPLGDGGSADDPEGRAQNLEVLHGKMLRLDVDAAEPYAVPPDNPFVGRSDARPEIWASGLRNPFRLSFDRQSGNLFIADVGQYDWEEINLQPATSPGGENYGWNCYEGTQKNPRTWTEACAQLEHVPPIFDYPHSATECGVIGGFIYRGRRYPLLRGQYVFADLCSEALWTAAPDGAGEWATVKHEALVEPPIVTFGEDVNGELYLANHNTGAVFHLQEAFAADSFLFLPVLKR